MNRELYDEAIRSNILSRKLIEQLMESMNYSSISFINWTVEVLKIIKTRLERGDKITDEVSGITYDIKSFRNFVSTNFSSYITSQVFDAPDKAEKVYFSLEATEDGHAYNMVMASSSKNKTYKWISSLSERFSLVEMIATGIVYLKDNRTDTYQPFISGNGKYCIIQNKQPSLSQYIQERILLAGFSACGGSLQRHNSSPSQCDPARRAFLCYRNITE